MPEVSPTKYLVQAGWDDVPHISAQAKEELLASTLPHLRDARSKGIPSIGSGAIYPIDLETILVDPFEIPGYWRRAFGMDVGWRRTAVVWGAIDDNDVLYLYSEHYAGRQTPSVHAVSIKARGDWIPGVIDPASQQRSQRDGEQLIKDYRSAPHKLKLYPAVNAVQAGIEEVWTRMTTGRLKVFRSLVNWQNEVKLYRRDENGKIVKENDHLMDATRYLCISGVKRATTQAMTTGSGGSRVANKIAGY